MRRRSSLISLAAVAGLIAGIPAASIAASTTTYDINTLAGKVASVRGTAGLQIRFSAFIEQESQEPAGGPSVAGTPISPTFVLSSPLDGTTVQPPDVTVNQDTAGAPQNETAIAVDPNNPNRILAGENDYVTRTWSCMVGGTPCSALGDAYSGTQFSNDGGHTWCCTSSDPAHLGTLIPGVEHLTGGQYDAGGDPAVTFDSHGTPYYAGLGFDRTAPPNTVTVSRGAFSGSGQLSWGAPTFVNATTSPSTLNDKEWIAADANASSPFRDRVYLSWTRFIFNAHNGNFVQAPIFFAYSSDGGHTFSTPAAISGNVLYDQGSRPVVGPDGSLYVFFEGATRLSTLDSQWVVKSTDGGKTFGTPVEISKVVDNLVLPRTAFRNNSFPAAAAAPNGDLYATWTGLYSDSTGGLCPAETNTGCHSAAVHSKSTDGGMTWSAPALSFPALDASTEVPVGYPAPDGLTAPAARRTDAIFPAVAVSASGRVYLSSYVADVVSPWQTCAQPATPTAVGRIDCLALGGYINNARLDYFVADLSTSASAKVSTHPINTRNGFGGGFFGDYTDIAAGSDNAFHALWTDSNNKQTVVWFYGYEFTPTVINQEDVVTASGGF